MGGSFRDVISEMRRLMGEQDDHPAVQDLEFETDEPPEDGSLDDWTKWAERVVSGEKYEAKVLKKHTETCSTGAMSQNIRHFYHIRGMKIPQAVAASYSILRKACGIPSEAPQMTPSQIVAKGAEKEAKKPKPESEEVEDLPPRKGPEGGGRGMGGGPAWRAKRKERRASCPGK